MSRKFYIGHTQLSEELHKAKKSLKPPKGWWRDMFAKLKEQYPKKPNSAISEIAGGIWANYDEKTKAHLRKREGKEYGPTLKKAQEPQSETKLMEDVLANRIPLSTALKQAKNPGAFLAELRKRRKEALKKSEYDPKKPKVLNTDTFEGKLCAFFRDHPAPQDDEVHQFAKDNDIAPDDVEERIYELISTFVNGGKSSQKKIDVADLDTKELKAGIEVEMEHLNSASPFAMALATKIVLDHEVETDGTNDYYLHPVYGLLAMEEARKKSQKGGK